MGILPIENAKKLRAQGNRLGRSGLSERVLVLTKDFVENDGSYTGAMKLAGRLKALSQAAKFDTYWDEQVWRGFTREMIELPAYVDPTSDIPDNGEGK